jgi:hypothetical protein
VTPTAEDTRDYPGAASFLPEGDVSLADLAKAAQSCHGCDLYKDATQTVFGRGAADASVSGRRPGRSGPAGRGWPRSFPALLPPSW